MHNTLNCRVNTSAPSSPHTHLPSSSSALSGDKLLGSQAFHQKPKNHKIKAPRFFIFLFLILTVSLCRNLFIHRAYSQTLRSPASSKTRSPRRLFFSFSLLLFKALETNCFVPTQSSAKEQECQELRSFISRGEWDYCLCPPRWIKTLTLLKRSRLEHF